MSPARSPRGRPAATRGRAPGRTAPRSAGLRRGLREPLPEARARARRILALLERAYPDARIALHFRTPLELLVATVLAAQCTDERVNVVTPPLFAKYRTASDWAAADQATLESEIRSTGFFRSKARAITAMARALVRDHDGEVPRTREALVRLPGVGLKTASVVLGNAFGEPAIAVDTHVFRISQRLGLARSEDPDVIHDQLAEVLPPAAWTRASHLFQAHGRRTCLARAPRCPVCPVRALCPWAGKVSGPSR